MNIKDFLPKTKEFVNFGEHVVGFCEENNYNIDIRDVSYLRYAPKVKCLGYCDEGNIVLARKHKLAIHTFIHEFAHSMQYAERSPLWEKGILDLEDIDAKISNFEDYYNAILLERDCEKRVLKLIDKFKLPINKKMYAKKSNCYLVYYHFYYLTKTWNSSVIYDPKIIKLMPDKLFSPSSLRKIDMDLMQKINKIISFS